MLIERRRGSRVSSVIGWRCSNPSPAVLLGLLLQIEPVDCASASEWYGNARSGVELSGLRRMSLQPQSSQTRDS